MMFSKLPSQNKNSGSNVVVAVDIGSSMLRMIAGEVNAEGHITVICYKECPSAGMTSGAVSDLSLLSENLSNLVQGFEQETGIGLDHIIIGIAGRHIDSRNEYGTTTVQARTVTLLDKNRAIDNATSVRLTEGWHIIHVVPQNYEIDNSTEITNPIGLYAMRLDVRVHIITCNRDQENNLRTALQSLSPNVAIDRVIFSGIAASDAVLTEGDKEIGVCLIDIGAGTADVVVYDHKKLVISFGLSRGGDVITRAIATHFGLPLDIAEMIKKRYGVAHHELLAAEDRGKIIRIPVNYGDGTSEEFPVPLEELAKVITYNLVDLVRSISDRIERISQEMNRTYSLGAGFVLTGGAVQMSGMDRFASFYLSPGYQQPGAASAVKVKIAVPRLVTAGQELMTSAHCVAVGLLRYGSNAINEQNLQQPVEDGGRVRSFYHKFRDWFTREF